MCIFVVSAAAWHSPNLEAKTHGFRSWTLKYRLGPVPVGRRPCVNHGHNPPDPPVVIPFALAVAATLDGCSEPSWPRRHTRALAPWQRSKGLSPNGLKATDIAIAEESVSRAIERATWPYDEPFSAEVPLGFCLSKKTPQRGKSPAISCIFLSPRVLQVPSRLHRPRAGGTIVGSPISGRWSNTAAFHSGQLPRTREVSGPLLGPSPSDSPLDHIGPSYDLGLDWTIPY